jgi:hypothetical protein
LFACCAFAFCGWVIAIFGFRGDGFHLGLRYAYCIGAVEAS